MRQYIHKEITLLLERRLHMKYPRDRPITNKLRFKSQKGVKANDNFKYRRISWQLQSSVSN